jgi:hypothetical protein
MKTNKEKKAVNRKKIIKESIKEQQKKRIYKKKS